ncbi:MAG: DUF935 family protein [Chitinophagales bacterium]|nr:DUF935 family protein [Chitinophagales bacterium]
MAKGVYKKKTDSMIIVNDLRIQTVDRTSKDIGDFINSLKTAESFTSPNRVQLYDLYKYAELDPFFSGVWQKRVANILNKKLMFVGKEGKEIDSLAPLFKNKRFRDLLEDLMITILYGRSGYEFIPGPSFDFNKIPRKHLKLEKKKITIFQAGSDEGFAYEELPNVWVLGDPDDLGILHKIAPYSIYKRNCLGDYSQFIEIFGIPMRVIKYDANDQKTKQELLTMAESAGSALIMSIPKQAEIEIKNEGVNSSANGDLQSKFIDLLNKEIAIYVLGNVETSMSGRTGSLAKAKVQGEGQAEILQMDLETVLLWLNSEQFLSILKTYGYSTDQGEFKWEEEVDNAWLKDEKAIDDWLISKGFPLEEDYIYEKYGRPKPKDFDARVQKMEEEKLARVPDPKTGQKQTPKRGEAGKPKKMPGTGATGEMRSLWSRLRHALADFFDPAPKD